jgi:RNA polymerase sigma-70 factor (ECF subfamily)
MSTAQCCSPASALLGCFLPPQPAVATRALVLNATNDDPSRKKAAHGRESGAAEDVAPAVPETSTNEDLQWVAQAQAGDSKAFDALIVKYSPRLYGLVYHMTSNHEDTNDLLQDVFAKAYRSIGGFRGKSSFYTWIHSIAVNMTINFLKKRGKRFHMSLDDVDRRIEDDKEFIELTATSTPVREANLSELQQRLNEAMMKLSHDHRAVVTMFDIQAMPHAEIAKILGISEGTVRSRLFYAHRQLQTYLEEFR